MGYEIIRTCRICKTDKGESFFYKNDRTNRCKACETSRKRQERKNRSHSDQDRRSWLKKNYGITPEQYQEMLENQNSKCAICKEEGIIKKGKLCIDHSHETNEVRGLLCHGCNLGLGHFQDKIDLLKNAIIYLKNGRYKIFNS